MHHQYPLQQHIQSQPSQTHSQYRRQSMQVHQQPSFIPPASAHQAHPQYQSRQPQLQLEHHYDAVEFDGLGALSYPPQQSQQEPVVIGVGQGPGNASPKYTGRTATALAANACPPDAFVFGQQQQQSQDLGSPNSGNGSPDALVSSQETFGSTFRFVAANPLGQGIHTGVPEGVPPLESLTSQQRHQQHQQQQDYLDPHGYTPQNKRQRADTVLDRFPSDGSGEEDAGQYAFAQPGEQYDNYVSHVMVQPGIPASGLSQDMQGGLLGQGVHYIPDADGGPGQEQTGPDSRSKQIHRPACVRCKNLKVRCEFTTDPNTCRRCLNGRHDCTTPGRKKRRQPPKREHLLNEIRNQADQIQKLVQQVEEYRRRALHNEPTRLSLSNTPLPPPGSASANGHVSSSFAVGTGAVVPRPDVQEWIERARESIQAIGGLIDNGALAEDGEGDEDGDEEEFEGDDSYDAYEGEESGFEENISEATEGDAGTKWREPARQDADTEEERDVFAVAGPPFSPDARDSVNMDSSRHASPASTVRSASREGSAQPSSRGRGHSHGRGGRRRTPQPPHLAPLPTTPAAPFGLLAHLGIKAEGHRQGSRSPKSSIGGAGGTTVEAGRGSGIEVDSPGGTGGAEGLLSPLSAGTSHTEKHVQSGNDGSGSDSEVRVSVKREESSSEGEGYGAAAPGFFEARRGSVPDPSRLAPARHPVPHILMRGIVSTQEVEILFGIYFDKMNVSCSLLDPILYTAQTTYWRSPFLFTVICAVASRYYSEHPGLYEELTTYAQLAAGTALISGPKNVETVSAYILLSLYPVPMRRWEEDRTWLYLGLAIRVATDLNLHHPNTSPPRNEQHARELLNRTRVWMNCYNLDRSTASWHGKASTIASRDYIACHSEAWYNSSPYNLPNFDIQLVAYNVDLRLLGEFSQKIYSNPNNPTGLNKDLDLNNLSSEIDETLVALEAEWNERLSQETDPDDAQGRFRNSLIKLAYRYARLTVLSFGFQHAFGKNHSQQASFFDRCYRAATEVLRVFIDELSSQRVYLRHGPDAQSVFVTFASAFLIKLLHPKYAPYLRTEQRKEIEYLVRGIIDLLSSPEVVVDDKHSPKLWSRFLNGLLATPMAKVELSPNALKGGSGLPRRPGARKLTQRTSNSSDKQNPSQASPASPDSVGTATHSPSSPSTGVEALNASRQALCEASSSPPPPANLTNTMGSLYPATNEASDVTFDFNHGHTQGNFQTGLGMDGSQQGQHQQGQHGMEIFNSSNALQMNVPEFFHPPLPFDNDLLQSIQSMPDTSLWQDMPGFNWMGALQSTEVDATMHDVLAPDMMNFSIHNHQY
ncbi:hypothetical protein M0805_009701 [Coniferiporia weirii]|nr:hypothetical protein M0805_009701 [Coniferiporia weirii]